MVSTTAATFYIFCWYTVNVATVILNKYIFKSMLFLFPVSLTAIHMLTCTVGCYIAIHWVKLVPWQEKEWSFKLQRVLPLAVLFVTNIVLGNVSLRWVSVSFMQTIKSSVPVWTVILQTIFLGKKFHQLIYVSLIPTVGGVMLASWTEAEFDVTGFWAALFASIITAAITVVSGILLVVKLDSINLLHLMAPISFLMLVPACVYTGELEGIIYNWYPTCTSADITILFVSGLIAFLLNVSTFLVIGATSALSFNIAGNFKVILSILFSVIIFHTNISFLNGMGIAAAIVGVAFYNYVRQRVEEKEKLELQLLKKVQTLESVAPTKKEEV